MRDIDIRRVLRSLITEQHAGKADTLVVEELGLCQGQSRIDMAIINGLFIGYEIKSARDTLERLPGQVETYNRVLDEVTIVASECHEAELMRLVPDWWAIAWARHQEGQLRIVPVREGRRNQSPDPSALVQLLWRTEALQILEELGLDQGVRSKSRQVLWTRLATELEWEDLHAIVRNQLKRRRVWRAGAPQP